MEIAEVKAFNAELSALYDNKPPISKAKMNAITKGAIKAIKFYKHVVHSVEKFILKCKPEYKIPGLYVIDSIVRQSRHQFGPEKDVFAPRFAKNMQQTFINLSRCPHEDKRNIIRVLNLWQKNNVFSSEIIQPLFDLIHPSHSNHLESTAQQNLHSNGSLNTNAESRMSPNTASQHTPGVTPSTDMRQTHRSHDSSNLGSAQQSSLNISRRLLSDFEYESEDDGGAADSSSPNINIQPNPPPPVPQQPQSITVLQNQQLTTNYLNTLNSLQALNSHGSLGSILTPEILRQLQSMQQQIPNFSMQLMNPMQDMNYIDTSQPPPLIHKTEENITGTSPLMDEVNNESDIEFVDDAGPQVIEIDGNESSPSPRSSRRRRSRSHRSRSRSRRSRSRSRDRRRRNSRDRSKDRRPRERDRDREKDKEREKEREKDRERRKKGLPPIKKENLSVCSTTLWVGHLSKLVQAEELSDAFGAIGDVISIDLVPPRGCAFIVMNRRRDAARAFSKLNKHKMHGKAITVAWAPGKGVKGREWKDFWEVDSGACYIPWSKLPTGPNQLGTTAIMTALEEGGVFDEETLPPWLQGKGSMDIKPKLPGDILSQGIVSAANPNLMLMSPMQSAQNLQVDTSCLPPPLTNPLGYAPHPALPLTLPLNFGFKPTPQPAGIPPAFQFQAMLAQQHQLATQLLLAPPPHLPQNPIPPVTTSLPLSSESRQDDAMELDTADEHDILVPSGSNVKPRGIENDSMMERFKALVANPPPTFNIPPPNLPMPSLLGQPPVSTHVSNMSDQDKERDGRRDRDYNKRDKDRRDRDRDKPRHDRERDRPRNDRDRDRERDRGDRNDKERPGRERNNRWGNRDFRNNRDLTPDDYRNSNNVSNNDRTLQDRLWEMANGPRIPDDLSPRQNRNGNPDDLCMRDGLLGDNPDDMDRRQMGMRSMSPGIMSQPGSNGPMGPIPTGIMGPVGPMGPGGTHMGRSLPPMAPFRISRDDMRMRNSGPRGPMGPGSGRSGMWMDGPGPYSPRFNGGPSFNRPQCDGPPFDGPSFDRQFDGPSFDRPPFDRPPHFDNAGRPPFDGLSAFDNPRYEGPLSDSYYDRNSSGRPARGMDNRNQGNHGRKYSERGRDTERTSRPSRWNTSKSPESRVQNDKSDTTNESNKQEAPVAKQTIESKNTDDSCKNDTPGIKSIDIDNNLIEIDVKEPQKINQNESEVIFNKSDVENTYERNIENNKVEKVPAVPVEIPVIEEKPILSNTNNQIENNHKEEPEQTHYNTKVVASPRDLDIEPHQICNDNIEVNNTPCAEGDQELQAPTDEDPASL